MCDCSATQKQKLIAVPAKSNTLSSSFKAPSSAFLISRCILRLGQAAQKQQRRQCPNPKMYLEIRRANERLFSLLKNQLTNRTPWIFQLIEKNKMAF